MAAKKRPTKRVDRKGAIPALDHMIKRGIRTYRCAARCSGQRLLHFHELKKRRYPRQINYRGEIFIVDRRRELFGRGGMPSGVAEGFQVYRVKL